MAPGKRCKHCQQHKPFDQYSSHPDTVDRLQVWCKDCVRQAVRDWRAIPENQAKEKRRAAEYRQAKRDAKKLL